jgi:hypothetical protein
MIQQPYLWAYSKGNEMSMLKHTHMYGGTIHNSEHTKLM